MSLTGGQVGPDTILLCVNSTAHAQGCAECHKQLLTALYSILGTKEDSNPCHSATVELKNAAAASHYHYQTAEDVLQVPVILKAGDNLANHCMYHRDRRSMLFEVCSLDHSR